MESPRLSRAERAAWVVLAAAECDGRTGRAAAARAGGAAALLSAGSARWRAFGLGGEAAARLSRALAADIVARIRRIARANRLRFVFAGDPYYPPRLAELPDPPVFLVVAGDPRALGAAHPLTLVGTRAASPEALTYTEAAAYRWASAGGTVVSGGARGIDAAAHRAALDAHRDGRTSAPPTIAVLGGGHLRPYPPEHAGLFEAIVAAGGAVVSEFLPESPPRRRNFPRRNRLLAALGAATLVVEAPARSGALSTARHALDLGREVFVAPPAGKTPRNEGTRALAADGAGVLDRLEPAAEAAGLPPGLAFRRTLPLKGTALSAEDLARKEGIPLGRAERRLVEMERSGRIVRIPGGRYRLVGR